MKDMAEEEESSVRIKWFGCYDNNRNCIIYDFNKMLNTFHSQHNDIGPWDSNVTIPTFNLKYNERKKILNHHP